jgi:hypothetical protein
MNRKQFDAGFLRDLVRGNSRFGSPGSFEYPKMNSGFFGSEKGDKYVGRREELRYPRRI